MNSLRFIICVTFNTDFDD